MVATSLLGAVTWDTNSGAKSVTATPDVDDLITLVTAHTGNTSSTPPTDDQGGTYYEAESAVKVVGADTLKIWVRNSRIASAVSTVFTHSPGVSTGGGLAVIKSTGMLRVGANAVRQGGNVDNQISTTPPNVAPGSLFDPANTIIAAMFNAGAGIPPATGFTELFDVNYATPNAYLEVQVKDGSLSGSGITWGANSATNYCAAGIELDITSGAIPRNQVVMA